MFSSTCPHAARGSRSRRRLRPLRCKQVPAPLRSIRVALQSSSSTQKVSCLKHRSAASSSATSRRPTSSDRRAVRKASHKTSHAAPCSETCLAANTRGAPHRRAPCSFQTWLWIRTARLSGDDGQRDPRARAARSRLEQERCPCRTWSRRSESCTLSRPTRRCRGTHRCSTRGTTLYRPRVHS